MSLLCWHEIKVDQVAIKAATYVHLLFEKTFPFNIRLKLKYEVYQENRKVILLVRSLAAASWDGAQMSDLLARPHGNRLDRQPKSQSYSQPGLVGRRTSKKLGPCLRSRFGFYCDQCLFLEKKRNFNFINSFFLSFGRPLCEIPFLLTRGVQGTPAIWPIDD